MPAPQDATHVEQPQLLMPTQDSLLLSSPQIEAHTSMMLMAANLQLTLKKSEQQGLKLKRP